MFLNNNVPGRERKGREERENEMEDTGDGSVETQDPREWSVEKVATFVSVEKVPTFIYCTKVTLHPPPLSPHYI